MTEPTAADEPFRFLDFPKKLRRRILYHTDLVIPAGAVDCLEDAEIHFDDKKDKFYIKSESDEPLGSPGRIHFPASLFRVSKLVATEALETFFSENRICLCCTFEKNLIWLQKFPRRMLKRTRKLDIILEKSDLFYRRYRKPFSEVINQCDRLLQHVSREFDVSQLFLSLDGRNEKLDEQMTPQPQASRIPEKGPGDFWDELGSTVRKNLPNLKRFQAYLWIQPLKEDRLETIVMGPEFDSLALGKVPPNMRAPGLPHKLCHTSFVAVNAFRPYPEDDGKGCLFEIPSEDSRLADSLDQLHLEQW